MPNWCINYMNFYGERSEIETLHNKLEEWTSKEFKPGEFNKDAFVNILCNAGLEELTDVDNADAVHCRGLIDEIGEVSSYTVCKNKVGKDEENITSNSNEENITSNNDKNIAPNNDDNKTVNDINEDVGTDATFEVITSTVWLPVLVMWDKIIDALGLKTVGFNCFAEESGNELYLVYDDYKELDIEYICEDYLDGEDYNLYGDDENPLIEMIDKHLLTADDIVFYGQKYFNTNETDIETLIDRFENIEFKNKYSFLKMYKVNRIKNIKEY